MYLQQIQIFMVSGSQITCLWLLVTGFWPAARSERPEAVLDGLPYLLRDFPGKLQDFDRLFDT
jgi:hypothetical protein